MDEGVRAPVVRGDALERYRARIRRHVLALVRDPADADDLTQETLLRGHERLGTLREPEALGVWLYRIATRLCCDFLRREPRAAPAAAASEDGAERAAELVRDGGPDAERLADAAAMSACGERLLDALPDAQRAVLLLHDLQGLTSVEIARLTGSTPGSVKIRLHRARRRFREALERECVMYRDDRGVLLGRPRRRRS